MEEKFRKHKLSLAISIVLVCTLTLTPPPTTAWSNGGYSADPSDPDYGTHDWIAQHALDWLPDNEKRYISDNLNDYLYGTELPDNGGAPDGIGDFFNHHVYYYSISGVSTAKPEAQVPRIPIVELHPHMGDIHTSTLGPL